MCIYGPWVPLPKTGELKLVACAFCGDVKLAPEYAKQLGIKHTGITKIVESDDLKTLRAS